MARAVPRHARVAAGATAERADEVEELEVEVKPLPLGLGVRASLHDWHTWLVQPVHASSLGLFRVVFSICMYMQATHFNYIFEDFMTSKGVYPYPGLGWDVAGVARLSRTRDGVMLIGSTEQPRSSSQRSTPAPAPTPCRSATAVRTGSSRFAPFSFVLLSAVTQVFLITVCCGFSVYHC